MTRVHRALCWAYILAALLTARCAVDSAHAGAPWYAAGLFAVSLLLVVALAREYVAADERRAAGVRAKRAARVRALRDDVALGWNDLESSCCLRFWESRGAAHDSHTCARKDQAA